MTSRVKGMREGVRGRKYGTGRERNARSSVYSYSVNEQHVMKSEKCVYSKNVQLIMMKYVLVGKHIISTYQHLISTLKSPNGDRAMWRDREVRFHFVVLSPTVPAFYS